MIYANNSSKNRVSIFEANINESYFCPICGEPVILKRGSIREHHFAHKKDSICDSWHYDMSDWHWNWQLLFPEHTREVVVVYNGVKHRADICIGNKVIEFQHSPMSPEEFQERNDFYTSAGYSVYWLFDLTEEVTSNKFIAKPTKEWHYKWKYRRRTFDLFSPSQQKKIQVYLQLGDVEGDNYGIERLAWLSQDGASVVTMRGVAYNQDEFRELFIKSPNQTVTTSKEYIIADLFDTLIEKKVGGSWCVECLAECGKWVPFENCHWCKYSIECLDSMAIGKPYKKYYQLKPAPSNLNYSVGCLFRVKQILHGWEFGRDKVIDAKFDEKGMIIGYVVEKNGEIIRHHGKSSLRTIKELLIQSNANVIGVVNKATGVRAKIANNDSNRMNKEIFGYIGKNTYDYYTDRRQIFYAEKAEWEVEWEM